MSSIQNKRGFASDNNSGISPEVIQKLAEVNTGHTVAYGDDPYTRMAFELFKKHFGREVVPYFCFTGTAANTLSFASIVKSYHSVFCASTAHIYVDECGAPEKFAGCKLIPIETKNGKLSPELIKPFLTGIGFEHHTQPRIISISQPTEVGTVYKPDEIKKLSEFARENRLFLHMDGARLANAAVSLKLPFKSFTTDAGVDILSFGGTKNGLLAAESVVFLNPVLAEDFKYIRKQAMQLASKMRFVAAQFIAYLESDLWERNARRSNEMAQKLYNKIKDISQIKVTQSVEANGIFAIVPQKIIVPLRNEYFFYNWDENKNEVRWMTSFDTTEEDIDGFVTKINLLLSD
jgi:threonine aldolase